MKKIVTKNGQEFYVWRSRKEASKEIAVIVEGMKCAFVEGSEMDDSLYIKYTDGRTYFFNKFEESGKFRKTNFDVIIFSNDCISVAYGKVVLRNVDDCDEIYSPEKDSEEKNWYFDEKEPEITETEPETVTETEHETVTETESEMTTEIESAQETAEKTEIVVNMLKYGMSRSYRSDFMVKNLNLNKFLKALIKTIGLEKVKEVRYTSQGMNVFFEYHGEMYKCYTPQSKLYKLSGQRFNLITWKDLKKDSSEKSDDNSGSLYTGRSPTE